MIAANAHWTRARVEHIPKLFRDTPVGVLDGQGVDREVPKIRDAPFFKRIDLEYGIPGPDHRRLHTDVSGAKARPGPVGGAAIEGNADERNIELFWVADMRQPHEGRNAGKARINQRIHRLRMRRSEFPGPHGCGANYKAWPPGRNAKLRNPVCYG